MIKHATIVPLIGGETIGQELAFGSRPTYLMSYEAFWPNDRHAANHYSDVPYYVLDKNQKPTEQVDVIGTVCPCAGLSQLSHGYGDHNQNNQWMINTTKYILGEVKPRVFWGENAPGFAGKIGKNIREQMLKIAQDNGYSMSVYVTRTILHGGPQVRNRSFYFFWQGSKSPVFDYFDRPRPKIEDVIAGARGNSQRDPINKKTPSTSDPYYRYILEHIHGGMSHSEFSAQLEPANARGNDVFGYIEKLGIDYKTVGKWMAENGLEKEVAKCDYKYDKLAAGKSIMRRGTIVPKDFIGAFVGHYPTSLTHPVEDRYISYREAMTIMGLPDNFELLDQENSSNHICQNVPVLTAKDMAGEILKYLNDELPLEETDYLLQSNLTKSYTVNKTVDNNLSAFI